MKCIADIGYEYVQISGIGPLKPEFIRSVCDDNGLKIALTHTKLDIINDVESVIRYHQVLGCPYIGIGSSVLITANRNMLRNSPGITTLPPRQ